MRARTRRLWSLAALTLAALAIGLDATVLSVALPTLADALHASTLQLQWFVAAYTLALAAALLPGGLLGGRFGRRKILMIALAIFGAGSVGCAYASSAGWFIAARAVAGLGASLAVPVSLSVLPVVFPDEERTKAVGIWAAANFLALPIGPILGGWLLTRYWWGWVFLLNVPVVVLSIVAVGLLIPESRSPHRPAMDPVGILTSSLGLVGLTYGFIDAGEHGWGSTRALAEMIVGVAILATFVGWQRRLGPHRALVDLGLFGSRNFTWGTILAGTAIFSMFGVLFAAPQYFQAVVGTDAMGSGVRLLPLILGLALGAITADRATRLAGANVTAAAGFGLIGSGMAIGAAGTSLTSGAGFIAGWTGLCGLGMGFALSVAASAALGELSADQAGVGSALMQTVQKVGAPLAAAILGSVLSAGYRDQVAVAGLPAGARTAIRDSVFGGIAVARRTGASALLDSVRSSFVHGMSLMLLVCVILAAMGVALSLVFLPRKRTAAERQGSGAESEEVSGAIPI